jgi:hypothetical protein
MQTLSSSIAYHDYPELHSAKLLRATDMDLLVVIHARCAATPVVPHTLALCLGKTYMVLDLIVPASIGTQNM